MSRRAFSAQVRRELELNELPLQVLAALAFYGPLGGAELAARLALSRGSVSSLIADLSARGLIVTASDAGDRRRRIAHLTPAGQDVVERFLDLAGKALTTGSTSNRPPGSP